MRTPASGTPTGLPEPQDGLAVCTSGVTSGSSGPLRGGLTPRSCRTPLDPRRPPPLMVCVKWAAPGLREGPRQSAGSHGCRTLSAWPRPTRSSSSSSRRTRAATTSIEGVAGSSPAVGFGSTGRNTARRASASSSFSASDEPGGCKASSASHGQRRGSGVAVQRTRPRDRGPGARAVWACKGVPGSDGAGGPRAFAAAPFGRLSASSSATALIEASDDGSKAAFQPRRKTRVLVRGLERMRSRFIAGRRSIQPARAAPRADADGDFEAEVVRAFHRCR